MTTFNRTIFKRVYCMMFTDNKTVRGNNYTLHRDITYECCYKSCWCMNTNRLC